LFRTFSGRAGGNVVSIRLQRNIACFENLFSQINLQDEDVSETLSEHNSNYSILDSEHSEECIDFTMMILFYSILFFCLNIFCVVELLRSVHKVSPKIGNWTEMILCLEQFL